MATHCAGTEGMFVMGLGMNEQGRVDFALAPELFPFFDADIGTMRIA